MKRFRYPACTLLGLGIGLVAPVLAAAPAGAAELVGMPRNERVEFALTHADTVQIFNDPLAISPICWQLWNDLQHNRVFTPNVTYFSCMHDVTECVHDAVTAGAETTGVTWTWRDGAPYTCNPVW